MTDPARYDITLHQGATFELSLAYKGSDGLPVNMSGSTVTAQLWNRTATQKLADFTVPWVVQGSGMFKLQLPAAVTSGLTEQGQYDVMVTESGGTKYYLLEGTAFFNPGLCGR